MSQPLTKWESLARSSNKPAVGGLLLLASGLGVFASWQDLTVLAITSAIVATILSVVVTLMLRGDAAREAEARWYERQLAAEHHWTPRSESLARPSDIAADLSLGEAVGLGRYIVVDPAICHGEPTFRGTRIMVADVLEQVASGSDWDHIRKEWRDAIPPEAIAEAVRLGRELLLTHKGELTAATE